MDMSLLWAALGLMAAGVVLTIVGEIMKPRPAVDAAGQPSLWQLIVTALGFLVTGFAQLLNGPTTGHRVQGLGSILFGVGVILLVVFLVNQVLPKTPKEPTSSPTPSPS